MVILSAFVAGWTLLDPKCQGKFRSRGRLAASDGKVMVWKLGWQAACTVPY